MSESIMPTTIGLDLVDEDPNQPRTSEMENSDEPTIQELSESIKSMGVLQPILVVPTGNGRYKLVAGHRRTRAARIAGLSEIPAIVRTETDPEHTLAAQLVENVQRQNLSLIDLCNAIIKLKRDFGLSIDEIARLIGRHRSWVNKIVLVAEETGFVRLAITEGLFVNMEAAYRFRNLQVEEQESLYKEAAKTGVRLTYTAVVQKKKEEFFPDYGGYNGGGGYDPKKYAEPRSTYVPVQEEATTPKPSSEKEDETSKSYQASAVSVKPDPADFEAGGAYNKPVVYRDFGTTWVIRVSETTLRDLVEKRGTKVTTDEDLISGVSELFN